jgi:FG-GAP repeat protein/VCBS repeat protein
VRHRILPSSWAALGGAAVLVTSVDPLGSAQSYTIWEASTPLCNPGSATLAICFGSSLAAGSDHDGDSLPDLFAGEPTYGPPSYPGGRVLLLSGSDGSTIFTVTAATTSDRLGWSIAEVGDLDGDGVSDFLAGAPQFNLAPLAGVGPGYARVCSGADGSVLLTLNGLAVGDRFGWSVSGAGDLTGDAVPDLLVGAIRVTLPLLGGYVNAYSGLDGSFLFGIPSTAPTDWLGASVAGGEDLTGDGVPDVLAGAPQIYPASLPGEARVYSGATAALVSTVVGTTADDRFGSSLAFVGDLDGDGRSEYVVGAPQPFGLAGGYARVYSGSTGGLLFHFSGTSPYSDYGTSVAGGEDIDGDGIPDVVVGAPGVARIEARSGANGNVLVEFTAPDLLGPTSGLGASVALPGDMNGDGFADFAAGAPEDLKVRAFSWLGMPPGSAQFGAGCPGSGNVVPELLLFGGYPASGPGNPGFGAAVIRALGGTVAVLILGSSFQDWNGLPLPLDLTPFGLSGCSLFVSADVLLPAVTNGSGPGGGVALFPLPVPANPALFGVLLHLQGFVVDPGPALLPGSMTRAVQVLIS